MHHLIPPWPKEPVTYILRLSVWSLGEGFPGGLPTGHCDTLLSLLPVLFLPQCSALSNLNNYYIYYLLSAYAC